MSSAAIEAERVARVGKPTSGKPASGVIAVAPGSIVMAEPSALFVDTRNARADRDPADVDTLAATIMHAGVLQPLLGYAASGDTIAITDGARRLCAINRLVQRGAWSGLVPVRLHDADEAEYVAITANTQRVQLTAAAEARAFAKLLDVDTAGLQARDDAIDAGVTRADAVKEIARAFGVETRHVEQRLTLAALHPPILDALDDGAIDLDIAKAYARAEVEVQATVWDAHGAAANDWTIKNALAKTALAATDAIARFVGEAAYIAAGGVVRRDFFADADDGSWADRKLAEKLAGAKLADEKARLEAEGWSFVETLKSEPSQHMWPRANAKKRVATDAEAADLADIAAQQKAIEAQEEAIYNEAGRDAGLTPEQKAIIDANERTVAALDRRADALAEALWIWDDKIKAKAGALAFIDDDGALRIWRGVTKYTRPNYMGGGQAATKDKGAAKAAKPAEPEIARDTRYAITTQASIILGRAIAADPRSGLALVAADLARQTLAMGDYHEEIVIEARRCEMTPPFTLASDDDWSAQRAAWTDQVRKHLKKPGALEAELLTWTPDALAKLIAHCVGGKIDGTYTSHGEAAPDDLAPLAAFGRALNVDPGFHWTPSLDVMKGFSEAALRKACAEIGVEAPATASKASLAAIVADRAAAVKWTPPIVRAICGASWTKLEVAKQPKKRGRPSKADLAARAAAEPITAKNAPVIGGDAVSLTSPLTPAAKTTKKAGAKKTAKPKQKVARKSAVKAAA